MNNHIKDLEATINKLAAKGKGILAADESIGTITKRFEALSIPSTEDTRRDYREMLVATPGLNEYVAGVILFEETLNQKTKSGQPFPEFLKQQGILPGIKVDKGLVNIPYTQDEQTTQGLDGLCERLADYKAKGACFAKWRAVYAISANTPSALAIRANAEGLASYAAACQANGIVPIVEPEILLDGEHTIERCAEVTENVLHAVFHSLFKHKVKLEYIILKPSMVISGKKCASKATAEQVAKASVTALRRTVPAAVPTINFLSGGQSPEEATANLNGMNMMAGNPWNLSFSYARALQDYSMKTWKGDAKNLAAAQKIFLARAKLNSLASVGKYTTAMEKETSIA
ncbi:MAG: fructose-bisphosphate aldolase class I [Gammaproteobacteria bacterium]|nr:fructose-bisphosphate aldolase class I [Gammaproteobacteria bacterium]